MDDETAFLSTTPSATKEFAVKDISYAVMLCVNLELFAQVTDPRDDESRSQGLGAFFCCGNVSTIPQRYKKMKQPLRFNTKLEKGYTKALNHILLVGKSYTSDSRRDKIASSCFVCVRH